MEGAGEARHQEVSEPLEVVEVQVHDFPEGVVEVVLQEAEVGQQKEEGAEELRLYALGVVVEEGLQAMEVVVEGLQAMEVAEEVEHHLKKVVVEEVVVEHHLNEMVEEVVVEHHLNEIVERAVVEGKEVEHQLKEVEGVEVEHNLKIVVEEAELEHDLKEMEVVEGLVYHVKEGEGEAEVKELLGR